MLLKFADLYHPRNIHDEWSVDKSSTHLCGRQAKNGFCEWLAYMMDNGFKSILKQNSYFELYLHFHKILIKTHILYLEVLLTFKISLIIYLFLVILYCIIISDELLSVSLE